MSNDTFALTLANMLGPVVRELGERAFYTVVSATNPNLTVRTEKDGIVAIGVPAMHEGAELPTGYTYTINVAPLQPLVGDPRVSLDKLCELLTPNLGNDVVFDTTETARLEGDTLTLTVRLDEQPATL